MSSINESSDEESVCGRSKIMNYNDEDDENIHEEHPKIRVTLPDTPQEEMKNDDVLPMREISAMTLSNAAMYVVDIIDKRENISKVSVEKSYSIKDGNIKTRVEIDLVCNIREISSFA